MSQPNGVEKPSFDLLHYERHTIEQLPSLFQTVSSSTLLGRVDEVGSGPRDGLPAGATGAGPDAEQGLEFAEYGVESQAGAGAFGSLRSSVQNA